MADAWPCDAEQRPDEATCYSETIGPRSRQLAWIGTLSVAREKSLEERLFAAAVLRRSFELRGEAYADGFRFVYEGVLRDMRLEDDAVVAYLAAHLAEVEQAIGRKA